MQLNWRSNVLCRVIVLAVIDVPFGVRALGGYLKWTYDAPDTFYPFDTPYSPAIVRGDVPGRERVVTLNIAENNQWQASALDIVSGRQVWNAIFPSISNDDILSSVLSSEQHMKNEFNLALLEIAGSLVALDGLTGQLAWQWIVPSNLTIKQVSGWDDTVALLLNGEVVINPFNGVPSIPTIIAGLDARTGVLRWEKNGTDVIPQTQSDLAQYSVEYLIAGKGVIVFTRGSRLGALDTNNGTVLWTTSLALEGSVGTGQGANITHVTYLPDHCNVPVKVEDDCTAARILINANNWSFQRFALMVFNQTNSTVPPTVQWRSRLAETALLDLTLTQPVVDDSPETQMFYYWSNRTNWNVGEGETPISETYLVGRSLVDGKEVWNKKMEPVLNGIPSASNGRVYVVSDTGLHVIQGTSGSLIWEISESPTSRYSYRVTPTFGNLTGQLVASRCLGSSAPALCMYSGFEPNPGNSAKMHGSFATLFSLFFMLITAFLF